MEASEGRSEDRFCYMMVNFKAEQKINTYIGEGKDPYEDVLLHNSGRAKDSKSTRSAAPNWELNMIIGPFKNSGDACKFVEPWRVNSRGILSRRKRGMELARLQNLTCWDKEERDTESGPSNQKPSHKINNKHLTNQHEKE